MWSQTTNVTDRRTDGRHSHSNAAPNARTCFERCKNQVIKLCGENDSVNGKELPTCHSGFIKADICCRSVHVFGIDAAEIRMTLQERESAVKLYGVSSSSCHTHRTFSVWTGKILLLMSISPRGLQARCNVCVLRRRSVLASVGQRWKTVPFLSRDPTLYEYNPTSLQSAMRQPCNSEQPQANYRKYAER